MGNGLLHESNHFLYHGSNVFYLCTDLLCHIQRRTSLFLEYPVVFGKLFHAVYNKIGTVFVFIGKFADYGDTVYDGMAGILNLFDGKYHSG